MSKDNVVMFKLEKDEEEEVDVQLWFGCVPPALIPVSERAKALLELPQGFDAGLNPTDAIGVMDTFPNDYLFEMTEEPPNFIAVATTKPLH